jgi:spore coat protein CotH
VLAVVALVFGAGPALAFTQDDFFDDSALQEIRIAISNRYWEALRANVQENTYYPADLTWRGITVRNIAIRSRGSGTRSETKPGIHVDLNRYVSNQQLFGLTAFDLKNMHTDPSLLRESVAMKLHRRMGVPASREAHARLYVNNEYAGLYVLAETVDRAFVSRVFGAHEADVEKGGYLFEYRWRFVYGFEYLGPDLRAYAALFEPQTRETDAIVNLYGPIEDAIRAINEAPDEDVGTAVGQHIDLAGFMKFLAVELFTVEWDGLTGNWGANNFYLYRFREASPARLIPWDRDHAFVWDGVNASAFISAPIGLRVDTNVLARRMLADARLRQIFLTALMDCAGMAAEPGGDDGRGWLEREIDRQARLIAPAVADDPVFPFSWESFQAEVDFLERFARSRPTFVSCEVRQTEGAAGCQ